MLFAYLSNYTPPKKCHYLNQLSRLIFFINKKVSSMIVMPSMLQSPTPALASSNTSSSSLFKPSSTLADSVFQLYMKNFHMRTFDDHMTEMFGLNLAGIRETAAMRLISQEMLLVAIAITLIVVVTLLYLRSIFISMVVNLGVGMSVGVAFFAYRIVFGWDLFPFLNMMAVFLLIGIACDNVYVLFDSWYAEKARVIAEDLPEMIKRQWSTNANLNQLASQSSSSPTTNNTTTTTNRLNNRGDTAMVMMGNRASNIREEPSMESSASADTAATPMGAGSTNDKVKVVNVRPNEQLLPPIYVKRTMFWEQKSNGSTRKRKSLAVPVNDINENDVGSSFLYRFGALFMGLRSEILVRGYKN